MRNLLLTDEQAAIVREALVQLHDLAHDSIVNTNYYGNHRSLDNEVTDEELQNEIDVILNLECL